MPITSAVLSSILRVKKEFNLETGDLDLTQLSDFAGYGIIAPDTAKTLLKVIDPLGATLYINAGFDTDDYTSPDFTLVTTTKALTMPTDVNGDYLTGVYTIYMKCQVVDDSTTVVGSATTTSNVCDCAVTVSIELEADYATAVLTSTDTTNYGAYSSISRTHTIYPPPVSGLASQTTSATTNVYSNIVTTTWSSKIVTDITYLYANDTYVTCEVEGSAEINVEADTLCKTLCLLKKFRTDFYSKYGKKNTADMEEAYQLAVNEFALAMQASRCGQNIDTYINKIYEITGLDPDCDCGCSGSFPTPVVPTSIINGTDGTDGVTPQFQNTGTWIQVSYDEGLTWNNLFSLASVTGAAGANGTNGTDGADGVAVLHNDLTASITTTDILQKLKTFSMTAGQLANDGDMIEVRVKFSVSTKDDVFKSCYLYLGGSPIIGYPIFGSYTGEDFVARISRTSPSDGKLDSDIYLIQSGFLSPFSNTILKKLTSLSETLANSLDIEIWANDGGGQAITCDLFQVTYYKA